MQKRCGSLKAHDSHIWITTKDELCSGQAMCGEFSHSQHLYKRVTEAQCPGLCLCGLIKHTHGPGEHK